eukprot:scaffold24.g2925.t1
MQQASMQSRLSTRGATICAPRRAAAARARPTRAAAYLDSAPAAPAPPAPKAANQLEALKQMSKVVADTGEISAMKLYKPVDCTTNPSLVLKAMSNPDYVHFLHEAIAAEKKARGPAKGARPHALIADQLAVTIGCELLKLIPGRVSTEVDAHLSYDTKATVDKALRLVDLYAKRGVEPSRLYAASTWEGIRACEQLQKQGIDCNMTLLFSFAQAAACADAGAALISPFVGRILDWYKKHTGRDYAAEEDPGVLSVQRIYKVGQTLNPKRSRDSLAVDCRGRRLRARVSRPRGVATRATLPPTSALPAPRLPSPPPPQYYKRYGYATVVMAASFRNAGEIRQLAGVDNITISPALLAELEASADPLPYKLWPDMGGCNDPRYTMDDSSRGLYDQLHSSDAMAVDKLKEGIDGFAADQLKLEELIGAAVERAGQ